MTTCPPPANAADTHGSSPVHAAATRTVTAVLHLPAVSFDRHRALNRPAACRTGAEMDNPDQIGLPYSTVLVAPSNLRQSFEGIHCALSAADDLLGVYAQRAPCNAGAKILGSPAGSLAWFFYEGFTWVSRDTASRLCWMSGARQAAAVRCVRAGRDGGWRRANGSLARLTRLGVPVQSALSDTICAVHSPSGVQPTYTCRGDDVGSEGGKAGKHAGGCATTPTLPRLAAPAAGAAHTGTGAASDELCAGPGRAGPLFRWVGSIPWVHFSCHVWAPPTSTVEARGEARCWIDSPAVNELTNSALGVIRILLHHVF